MAPEDGPHPVVDVIAKGAVMRNTQGNPQPVPISFNKDVRLDSSEKAREPVRAGRKAAPGPRYQEGSLDRLFDDPMGQLDELLPFQRHSITSESAAMSMGSRAKGVRRKVLEALRERPMTDEELIEQLGGNPSTIRPRRVELYADGLIEPAGTRKTHSNRDAVVWQTTGADA